MAKPISPPWILLILFHISLLPLCFTQSNSPQNIETHYPLKILPSSPPPLPSKPPPLSNSPQLPPLPPAPEPVTAPAPAKSNGKIAKAVAATAASTLVVTGLAFLLIQRWIVAKRKREKDNGTNGNYAHSGGGGGRPVLQSRSRSEFVRYSGDLKGFIVDENGLDVLYWRKLERKNSSPKKVLRNQRIGQEEEDDDNGNGGNRRRKNEPIQEIPLLRGKSSTSHVKVVPDHAPRSTVGIVFKDVQQQQPEPSSPSSSTSSAPPPSSPPTPPPQPPPPQLILSIPNKKSPLPPPPPPPPIPLKKSSLAVPPAPPPPKARSLNSIPKPPPGPKGKPGNTVSKQGEQSSGDGQVKLKPLHWDKVNTNAQHSMVWDKINDNGSFRFDGDLMEALFGYVATNRKSPKGNETSKSINAPPPQIFILDTRKSQNIAIILKSIYISRKEIIDALMEGRGLNAETLEKLSKIAPTEEEQSQILEFDGDPTRLADAESFLFHILKVVPSAFTRLNAMLFRSNYALEIQQLKASVQTLESGCKELRTRGLFMKLLEAILKAGNRMNAGTSRGNAQAFNLNSLRKLSDVRSSDGKTTLLHFVVEEVVRSEGKRCVLNRNRSLSRSSSKQSSSGSFSSTNSDHSRTTLRDEREKEYVMLGLPVVGGLSSEFSNVKKAATIDSDNFSVTCSLLSKKAEEIRRLIVSQSVKGGFAREMESFLEAAEEELEIVAKEQTRVMELVTKTTEYYQAGASKDKGAYPFQLFVIVKDFLVLVDQVCVEIARSLQRKRVTGSSGSSSFSTNTRPPSNRVTVRFPNLPENFMSDKSFGRSSSDSDDD